MPCHKDIGINFLFLCTLSCYTIFINHKNNYNKIVPVYVFDKDQSQGRSWITFLLCTPFNLGLVSVINL